MCGIAGILSPNSSLVAAAPIASGTARLRHRGPDEGAAWHNGGGTVAFGHRRLCIIDLSREAAQPMTRSDRFTIVHNGELYNYIELRAQLQQQGQVFSTGSDTEVILAAYAAWGAACLQRFDGMFAFAIWDEQEQTLFAARDRFGEKPFFFFFDAERLCFASEMKALWDFGLPKAVNGAMLYNFLSIGYTGNPAAPGETFYQHVSKLPAASCLLYKLRGHELVIEKYWQPYPEVDDTITEKAAVEKFRELFSDSIAKRLRSDVAVGTSLSGGLDSSAVVAFCDGAAAGAYSHRCFTASFDGFEKDELPYARMVAERYGLKHHVIRMDGSDTVACMEEVMRHQEEPFGSASVLAQYKVYEAAKAQGVTVLLDGQGADEVLAGYRHYYKWHWGELYRQRRLGRSGEREAAKALGIDAAFGWREKGAALLPELAAGLLQSRKARQAFRHPGLNRDFAFAHKRELYYATPSSFDLNGALFFNTFVQGLEELLRLADRNSMAHGTEVRLPFLSHELVTFLFTLPPHFKIHEGWTKWLLRKAAEDRLPSGIAWRKDKTGFEPPQKEWMQRPDVSAAILEGKKKLVAQGILDAAVLKKAEPHSAYAARSLDWKCWSASYLF